MGQGRATNPIPPITLRCDIAPWSVWTSRPSPAPFSFGEFPGRHSRPLRDTRWRRGSRAALSRGRRCSSGSSRLRAGKRTGPRSAVIRRAHAFGPQPIGRDRRRAGSERERNALVDGVDLVGDPFVDALAQLGGVAEVHARDFRMLVEAQDAVAQGNGGDAAGHDGGAFGVAAYFATQLDPGRGGDLAAVEGDVLDRHDAHGLASVDLLLQTGDGLVEAGEDLRLVIVADGLDHAAVRRRRAVLGQRRECAGEQYERQGGAEDAEVRHVGLSGRNRMNERFGGDTAPGTADFSRRAVHVRDRSRGHGVSRRR